MILFWCQKSSPISIFALLFSSRLFVALLLKWDETYCCRLIAHNMKMMEMEMENWREQMRKCFIRTWKMIISYKKNSIFLSGDSILRITRGCQEKWALNMLITQAKSKLLQPFTSRLIHKTETEIEIASFTYECWRENGVITWLGIL